MTDGWQMSDFVRTLVVMGAAANWLGLQSEESAQVLRMKAELSQLSERIGKLSPSFRHGRPYAPRSARDSEVIALILPHRVAQLIESYVALRGMSKNDLCGSLLTQGLMIYLTGQKNLLQATTPTDRLPSANTIAESRMCHPGDTFTL